MTDKTIRAKALSSSAWTVAAFGASQVIRLGSHVVLAWMLSPAIFGVMALLRVFKAGLNLFSDIGIGPSIIQSPRGNDPKFQNTAWTIQVIRGLALWAITCILAWPYAKLYSQNNPEALQLAYLLPVAALGSIALGFNSTAIFSLQKDLRLARLTMFELAVQICSVSTMLAWAYFHPTPWAMVAGVLLGNILQMVLSHRLISGHSVRFGWDASCGRELIRYGKWIFLSTAFTFLATHLDKLVLGRLLSLTELGIYSISLVFAGVALEVVSRLSGRVLFPIFSKFQDAPERLIDLAIRSREIVLLGGFASCVCFAVAAPLFFELLWDERYRDAGKVSQWLTLYVWVRIMLFSMDRIPLALGNSRALFFSNVIQAAFVICAVAGYQVAELPGFIAGLSIGPIASQIFLLYYYVPAGRASIAVQSVRFTVITLVSVLAILAASDWVRATSPYLVWIIFVFLSGGLPGAIAISVIYVRLRNRVGRRNID